MKRYRHALALLLLGASAGAGTPQSPPAPIASLWSRPAPGTIALALSPEGSRLLAADAEGMVRGFDEKGDLLWERRLEGADSLATSTGGALTVAYARRQPLLRRAWLLDGQGALVEHLDLPEAVRTAVVSPTGEYAALAFGRTVAFCGRSRGGLRRRDLRFPGEPHQVQFGPGDGLYAALERPARVRHVKSTGRVLWDLAPRGAAGCWISASQNGRMLAVASESSENRVELLLADSSGAVVWKGHRPGRAPTVHLSAGGKAALLSYEHRVEHGARVRFERRLAYHDVEYGTGWTKGGAYTAPLFVGVDRAGEWVVALDTRRQEGLPRFRLYSRAGGRRWIYTAPAGILIATASADGTHVALCRTDGRIELLRVAPSLPS